MTIGAKFRSRGWEPQKPVLVIPGLCSSCLVVKESPYEEWKDKQIWLNLGSIGFDKIFLGNFLRPKKKDDVGKTVSTEDLDKDKKRKWMQHMRLKNDGLSDPPGIKVRAIKGLKGCAYLEPHSLMNSLSYVMAPLFDTLKDAGYTDKNLKAAPYDWRLCPSMLEERDTYFTLLKQMVQQLYADNDQKVVVIAHSLGTRVFHYFLLWIEDTIGRHWIDEKIDLWIPVGPLWLGAPKSIRAVIAGERMGLEDFLYPEEGIELTKYASSAWMFPTRTPDFEFQEFSFLRGADGTTSAKNMQEILEEGNVSNHWSIYKNHYEGNKYFGGPELFLKPPPISRIFAIYGINLKTETFYFFKENTSDRLTKLEMDPAGDFPNYVVEGGIAYETRDTKQNMLKGKTRSGDGTVPYASLAYCKKWRKDVKVRVEELEGADHRVILKDKRFHRLVLESVCRAPPLPQLPVSFQNINYDVRRMMNQQLVSCTLKLTRKGMRVIYSRQRKKNLLYNYQLISNIALDEANPEQLEIELTRDMGIKKLIYLTPQRDALSRELIHRCNFVEEGSMWEEEVRNELGQTSLHRAAMANSVEDVFILLQEGADVNAIDNNCFTPLHAAANMGNLNACLVLLQETDIDVEKVTSDHTTVLHLLCQLPGNPGGHTKLVKMLEMLKSKGADVNAVTIDQESCLHFAVKAKNWACVRWLTFQKSNVNCSDRHGRTPLHLAIEERDVEMARFLIFKGADKHKTTRSGKSAVAMAQDNPDMVKAISSSTANSLRISGGFGFQVAQKDLSEVDEYGQTALHRAAFENEVNKVFDLIGEDSVDVNAADRNSWTALHCAASKANLKALLLLLTHKEVDVTLGNNSGTTALHYLVRYTAMTAMEVNRQSVSLERLNSCGAKVNAKDTHGETPLHQAARRGNLKPVIWLLSHGADVNIPTSRGDTALHYAVHSGKVGLVTRILEAEPDLSISSKDGTALELAEKLNVPEVVEVLKAAKVRRQKEKVKPSPRAKRPRPFLARSRRKSLKLSQESDGDNSHSESDDDLAVDEEEDTVSARARAGSMRLVFSRRKAPLRRISEKKKMTRKETENVIVEMAGGKISKLECKDLSLSVSQALEEVMAALNDVL